MRLDVDKLTEILNNSSQQIKNLSNEATADPKNLQTSLQKFVPTMMAGYRELQALNFEELRSSIKDPKKLASVQSAIQNFLFQTKDAQEKVGAIQSALFANPAFIDFTKKLKDLSNFLKRGQKVENVEHEGI